MWAEQLFQVTCQDIEVLGSIYEKAVNIYKRETIVDEAAYL